MVAYNRQVLRTINSTKLYDFVYDKTSPANQRYQVRNISPFYVIKYFSNKREAREYFILLVSKSSDKEILKFMGIEYQLRWEKIWE